MTTLPSNSTYLQLLASLVSLLTKRLITFYKHQTQDQLIFKEQVQQLQDSLTYYEQFKPSPVKYSSLIQPLSTHLRLNTFKQYFSTPSNIINQLPGKQCQTQVSIMPKRRIYSSNNSLDANQHMSSNSNGFTKHKTTRTSSYLWTSQDKTRGSSVYLPGVVIQSNPPSSLNKSIPKKGKSLRSHNYQKQVSKVYDKIIGSVINSKIYKRKKYQCKVQNFVKSVQEYEQP